MKQNRLRILAVGVFFGILGTVVTGAAVSATSKSIRESIFPNRQNGIDLLGDRLTFAARDVKLEDLPELPNTDEARLGRYQFVARRVLVAEGTEEGSIIVFDTQNGLVREWTDKGQFRLYNATVPNHVITSRVRYHTIADNGEVDKN